MHIEQEQRGGCVFVRVRERETTTTTTTIERKTCKGVCAHDTKTPTHTQHAHTHLIGFLHAGKAGLIFLGNGSTTLGNLVGVHLQTLAFVGFLDFLGCGISLNAQESIKVFTIVSVVGTQKGLATAQEKGQIVSHFLYCVCVCVCVCVCANWWWWRLS